MRVFEDNTPKGANQHIVIITPKEAEVIGEALQAYSQANKRSKRIKTVLDDWDEKVPITG